MSIKERFGRLKGGTKEKFGRLTGRTVEVKVDKYSEIYGEVLLGMHRDLLEHNVTINRYERVMQQGLATVDQVRTEMTEDVAKVEGLLADTKRCKDDASKYSATGLMDSQNALKAAASAESAAKRSEKSAMECDTIANKAEEYRRGLVSRVEEQEQQLEKFRSEYRKFRRRVLLVLGSAAALVLIGVITWILHLRK